MGWINCNIKSNENAFVFLNLTFKKFMYLKWILLKFFNFFCVFLSMGMELLIFISLIFCWICWLSVIKKFLVE